MKKLILMTLLFPSLLYAADTKVTALTELTAIADADIMYVVDDPAGSPLSKKITVLNLFDTINTFLKLNTIVTDKTLVNEEDAVTWDALGTFAAGINLGTSQSIVATTGLTIGGNTETIAINSSDWDIGATGIGTGFGDFTSDGTFICGVGFDATGAVDIDYGSADITDHTFTSDGGTTIIDGSVTAVTAFIIGAANMSEADLETLDGITPGTAAASKALVLDGSLDIATINSLTATTLVGALTGNADTATLASTITVADNEATVETNAILFSPGGDLDGGNYTPESDGDLTYTPNTGTVGATEFSGGGGNLTGVDAATGDSATAFFDTGTIEHERGGLQADVSAFTGLIAITGADTTAEIDSKTELEGQIADVADFAEADGDVFTGDHDFGGADLELPQGQTPDTDGDVDLDFTDGSLVIQHGSAHAELAGATDVVMGKLIKSFAATIFAPDGVNDVIPVKPIVAGEFPHGIVVTEVHMVVGTDTNYTIDVENWDDFDTISAGNPSINSTAYTSGNNGEVTDSTITFATIAAGQIIMVDIPATDIDWVSITIFYYEPIS